MGRPGNTAGGEKSCLQSCSGSTLGLFFDDNSFSRHSPPYGLFFDNFLQDLINDENRPKGTRIIQIIQGYETHSFKSYFESWPLSSGTGSTGGEEGRGKVAGT